MQQRSINIETLGDLVAHRYGLDAYCERGHHRRAGSGWKESNPRLKLGSFRSAAELHPHPPLAWPKWNQ